MITYQICVDIIISLEEVIPNMEIIVGVFLASIKTDFPSHPLCWDALARRIWTGVDTATLTGQ